MKKLFKILMVVIVSIAIFMAGGFLYIKTRPIPAMEVGTIEIGNVKDGTYIGDYKNGPVKVGVRVEVKDKRIVHIEILEHVNGLGKKAEAITADIIQAQSLKVEVISGATYSSKVILKAVEAALENGKI